MEICLTFHSTMFALKLGPGKSSVIFKGLCYSLKVSVRESVTLRNEINDNKISTRNRIKQLINDQKQILELENYSDESLSEFINVLINAQKLKRESIEFEKIHLNKINDLIL